MDIFLPFNLAWRSLVAHKARTALTLLGIFIGIAAVIIVMSAGESIRGLVSGQLESFGTNLIQVEIKVPSTAKNSTANAGGLAQGIQVTTLKLEDAEAIGRLPNVKNFYAAVMGQGVVSYLDENKIINFLATTAEYINIDSSKLNQGRFYTTQEEKDMAKVVVLGSQGAEQLFGVQDPVGQSIKIGHNKFIVIGAFKERGGGFGLSFDDMIFLPLRTAQKLLMGIDYLMYTTVVVDDPAIQDATADEIINLLRLRHDIDNPKDDDFAVTTMAEAQDMINSVFGGITLLLVAIAGISLLVGGIGIMNIMYVSVTERTFEIGLRKAVGAKPKNILWQFLWEAVIVTLAGGVTGIIGGVTFTFLVSLVAGQFGLSWPFKLPIYAILIAVGFSAVVGIVFGYYPALKAAKMNPVEALRHE